MLFWTRSMQFEQHQQKNFGPKPEKYRKFPKKMAENVPLDT